MGICVCVCRSKSKQLAYTESPRRPESNSSIYLDRLTAAQLSLVKAKFAQHHQKGSIDYRGFVKLLPNQNKLPTPLKEAAFRLFNSNGSGQLTRKELCLALSKYLLGSREEKVLFIFSLFDEQESGVLGTRQIRRLRQFVESSVLPTGSLETFKRWSKSLNFAEFKEWATSNLNLNLVIHPFEIIPLPNSERSQVQELMEVHAELQPGSVRYLISRQWMETWRAYVEYPLSRHAALQRVQSVRLNQRPVEIDNSTLIETGCLLRPKLQEGRDYELLPDSVWQALHRWYGGGPEIKRSAGLVDGQLVVDVYPHLFVIHLSEAAGKSALEMFVTKERTVQQVIDDAADRLGNSGGKLYWIHGDHYKQLDPSWTVEQCGFDAVVTCVLAIPSSEAEDTVPIEALPRESSFDIGDAVEIKQDGRWVLCSIKGSTADTYTLTSVHDQRCMLLRRTESESMRRARKSPVKGSRAKGLDNIGNTCYMAAVVQCLANTPLLGDFFRQQLFHPSVNETNPSGTRGLMAKSFAALLQQLHGGASSSCRPTAFVEKFTSKYPDFQGNQQQDSHEFLRVLLSFLHEDLNRRTSEDENMTISLVNPTPDHEIQASQAQWHKIQGTVGSVISDFCGGQTKRSIACMNCSHRVSVFETFMDVSLPLPFVADSPVLRVRFMPRNSEELREFVFPLDASLTLEAVLSAVNQEVGGSVSNLVFAHVASSRIRRILPKPLDLEQVLPPEQKQLFLYEVVNSIEEAEAEGKPTLAKPAPVDWREKLSQGQFVDVLVDDGQWHTGTILHVNATEATLLVYTGRGLRKILSRTSPALAFFRTHTQNKDKVLHFTTHMFYGNELTSFGVPLLLSIGNWYSLHDLHCHAKKVCRLYSNRTMLELRIFIVRDQVCALCLKTSCRGCPLERVYSSLAEAGLKPRTDILCVKWTQARQYRAPVVIKIRRLPSLDIYDCLQAFIEKEQINMTCPSCEHPTMLSQTEIWRVPDILVVHLKRFYFKEGVMKKIKNPVQFPLNNFDIASWMLSTEKRSGLTQATSTDNHTFELYAVVNHAGNARRGHYTCSCYNEDLETWLEYDDEQVFQISDPASLVTLNAYILFFRRKRFASSNVVNLSL